MSTDSDTEYSSTFYCPITGCIMTDPVIDLEGNSYERVAIQHWITEQGRSPITRNVLRLTDLIPNRILKQTIEEAIQLRQNSLQPLTAQPLTGQLSLTSTSPVALDFHAIDFQLKSQLASVESSSNLKSYNMLASVQFPDQPTSCRIASDIILVIDISGSMNDVSKPPPSSGYNNNSASVSSDKEAENLGLTLLDIVKHAIRTVIETLNDNDRLALVTFSTNATLIFDFILMNSQGKQQAAQRVKALTADGMTNLWAGLYKGLELLNPTTTINNHNNNYNSTNTSIKRNTAMFLLTDGEPNIDPPRGLLPMLSKYKERLGGFLPCVIHTFGFGYSLDSKLLYDIACIAEGMYTFIPDSGFVGTSFVHALASTLTHVDSCMRMRVTRSEAAAAIGAIIRDGPCLINATTAGITIGAGAAGGSDTSTGNRLQPVATARAAAATTFIMAIAPIHIGQSIDLLLSASLPTVITSGSCPVDLAATPLFQITVESTRLLQSGNSPQVYAPICTELIQRVDDSGVYYTHSSSTTSAPTATTATIATASSIENYSDIQFHIYRKQAVQLLKQIYTIMQSKNCSNVSFSDSSFSYTQSYSDNTRTSPLLAQTQAQALQSDSKDDDSHTKQFNLKITQQLVTRYIQEIDSFLARSVSAFGSTDSSSDRSTRMEISDGGWCSVTAAEATTTAAAAVSVTALVRIRALKADFAGQVSESLSRLEWYERWGRHYLLSLSRAHEIQQCTNFKDPGLQYYGGRVFRDLRDLADELFCSLPPPTFRHIPPTATAAAAAAAAHVYTSATAPRVTQTPAVNHSSMAVYNNRNAGCIHGDCLVRVPAVTTADSDCHCQSFKRVRDLRRGDLVYTRLPPTIHNRGSHNYINNNNNNNNTNNNHINYSWIMEDQDHYQYIGQVECVIESQVINEASEETRVSWSDDEAKKKCAYAYCTSLNNEKMPETMESIENTNSSTSISMMTLVHFDTGLVVTPWHPVKLPTHTLTQNPFTSTTTNEFNKNQDQDQAEVSNEGEVKTFWFFPANIASNHSKVKAELKLTQCESVFNFIISNYKPMVDEEEFSHKISKTKTIASSIVVNEIECITLGHDIQNDDVSSHSFFGNSKRVVESLSQCKGWNEGYIKLKRGAYIRGGKSCIKYKDDNTNVVYNKVDGIDSSLSY